MAADLKTSLLIALQTTGEERVAKLRQSLLDLGLSADKAEDLAGGLDKELKEIADSAEKAGNKAGQSAIGIKGLATQLGGLVTAGAVLQFAKDSVESFARAESAFRGLESQAKHSGVSIGRALDEANKLAEDGLIDVASASKALQNLLSRGYSIEQAVDTLTRLKDAAAFNRQANLGLADAVVNATEGLKNENSTLVDNAGVTKNVAKMWEEYAKRIGVGATELTQAQKIEAEYQGIMRETEAQVGNAAKALEGYQGQAAAAAKASNDAAVQMGQSLVPAATAVSQAQIWLVENGLKPLILWAKGVGTEFAMTAAAIGTVMDAIKQMDFTDLGKKLDANVALANEQMRGYEKQLKTNTLEIAEQAREAEKLGKAGKQAGKEMADGADQAAAAAKQADAAFKALTEQIQASARAASAENGLAQTSMRLAIEQAKTLYELAKAKGDTAGATAAKNKISELEIELSRLQAQAAIAEATATLELAQAKYKNAFATKQNVEAAEAELTAAGYNYAAKEVQSQITEELAGRTKKLKEETDRLSTSTGGAAGAIGDMGGSMASTGGAAQNLTRDIDELAAAEQRLAGIRDAANAARGQGGTTSWEYILGSKGIKLSTEQLAAFKQQIESTYEYLRGSFDGQVVSSTHLIDEAVKQTVKLVTATSGGTSSGGGTTTSATNTSSNTPTPSAARTGVTIIVQGDALDADGLVRKLQPALDKLTRWRA